MCVTVVDSNDPPTVMCPGAGAVTITEVLHMVGFYLPFCMNLHLSWLGRFMFPVSGLLSVTRRPVSLVLVVEFCLLLSVLHFWHFGIRMLHKCFRSDSSVQCSTSEWVCNFDTEKGILLLANMIEILSQLGNPNLNSSSQ